MNIRRTIKITVCLTALALSLSACASVSQEEKSADAESVILVAAPEKTTTPATPSPTPAPTREPSPNDAVPTITPRITFVPIPQSEHTPDSRGRTPTPSPEWATPYPEYTGTPTVKADNAVSIARLTEKIAVRKKAQARGSYWGYALPDEEYRILAEKGDYYQILFHGEKGYIPSRRAVRTEKSLRQEEVLQFTVGTLNIHGMNTESRLAKIVSILNAADADVVGLQEVSRRTQSGGWEDWLERLAEAAGYPYFTFCKTISYDGGDYGIAVISKYPIIADDGWKLDVAPGKESRALEYTRILFPSGAVHVFNTHLCASEMHLKSINIASMVHTLDATGLSTYVVTGDFNCSPPRIFRYKKDINFSNMELDTFGDGKRPKIIDNVLYAGDIVVPHVELVDAADTGATDHRMLISSCYQLIP